MEKIQKRDGRVVSFDATKIVSAVQRAAEAVGVSDEALPQQITAKVMALISSRFPSPTIPTVEDVQDAVEQILMAENQARIAKAYILYRQKRTEIRFEKQKILEKEEIDEVDKHFDLNSLRLLRARYLKKDEKGHLLETPRQLFQRVAIQVVLPSLLFDRQFYAKEGGQPIHPSVAFEPTAWEGKLTVGPYSLNRFHLATLKRLYDRFNQKGQMKETFSTLLTLIQSGQLNGYQTEISAYERLMTEKLFLPNTPALVNFGNYLGMGSACFVLEIEDSVISIMETLKKAAIIFQSGGGVGYNFSNLRPEGDFVRTTGGKSSGPLSFMELFDKMTEVIKQGGVRRGASIAILDSDHPDIEKFIQAKEGNRRLRNFNLAVRIKPDFWEHYAAKKPYPLINPRNGAVVRHLNPEQFWEALAYQAWGWAEPGVIFADNVEVYNPLAAALGPIKAVNPCGEALIYPNESCNLGSLNLWVFRQEKGIDWVALRNAVQTATRFLDNVVEVNAYPLPKIEKQTLATRKIGLGVMGLADLLFGLDISYRSPEGLELMEQLMEFINYHSKSTSVELAVERGSFPLFHQSSYAEGRLPLAGLKGEKWLEWDELTEKIKKNGIRNAYTTVVAPTGSLSMIAGTSAGIEPLFGLIFQKKVTIGSFYYVDPVFEKRMQADGLLNEELLRSVAANHGSLINLNNIPENLKTVFVTALDLSPEEHLQALAAIQKWVDSAVSKTINLPKETTAQKIKEIYLLAHQLGCKDVTVFREHSLVGVLNTSGVEFCPECGSILIESEGCQRCPACGWALCA